MSASWPSWAIDPSSLNEGLQHVFADKLLRTEFEQGAARQRRRTRSSLMTMQVRWAMSPAQYELFNTWRELDAGADWFSMSVYRDDDYEDVQARFVKSSIQVKRQDGEWIVDAKLEMTPLSTLTSAQLDAAIGAAGAGMPDWPQDYFPAEPLNSDYAIQIPDTGVRSDFDFGDVEQSKPFANGPATFTVTWPFSNYRYKLFRAWLNWRLGEGERWFTVPIFRGDDYETLQARFVKGSLTASREGDDWIVKAKLETADLPPADSDNAVIEILGNDLFTIASLLDEAVHISYPGAIA